MKGKKRKRRYVSCEAEEELIEAARRESEEELLCASYRYLRMAPSAIATSADEGRELYSFSDSRAFAELSDDEKTKGWKKPAGASLIAIAAFLTAWFLFSLIYLLSTEADKGKTALFMLASLLVVAVADAILLISTFGMWGKFLRFVFRHNLARARDAYARRQLAALRSDYRRADERKHLETAVSVFGRAVVFTFFGEKYAFAREAVSLAVRLENGALALRFTIDDLTLDFPFPFPKSEYVPLKKAFRENMRIERGGTSSEQERDKEGRRLYGGATLGSLLTGSFFATLVLAAAVMLIVAHYLWLPQLPPFVGIFFVGAAALAFCNTYHFIPVVDNVLLPLVFSLILTAIPFWMLVWIETEAMGHTFTFVSFITHCTPYAAGCIFLSLVGVYAFVFSVEKAVDYARFGSMEE